MHIFDLAHGAIARPNLTLVRCARRDAFTSIELLVVISIIAILAALMLPALGRAKEETQLLRCKNNLKQIGFAFQLYRDENSDRFPTNGHPPSYEGFQYGGGDPDRRVLNEALAARNRALWAYTKGTPELFHCAADLWTAPELGLPEGITQLFQLTGTSYAYNINPWWNISPGSLDDPINGLSGKPFSWVPNPSRYILLWEPPACTLSAGQAGGSSLWAIWHFRRGPAFVNSTNEVRQKILSPILFVDGHVAAHDFTAAVKSPNPLQDAPAWIWYKPAQ
jgi:type II secretory pathway pseudopilin PulG